MKMRIGVGVELMSTGTNASPAATPSSLEHDTWHSPVPYLFGGLAAMLGLIAFALLILACSYWRLSNYLDHDNNSDHDHRRDGNGDLEKGAGGDDKPRPCFGEGFVVIMAGDQNPTFLATPISSRASSFGDAGKDTAEDQKALGEEGKGGALSELGGGGDRNQEQ